MFIRVCTLSGRGPWFTMGRVSPAGEAAQSYLAHEVEPTPYDVKLKNEHWFRPVDEKIIEAAYQLARESGGLYVVKRAEDFRRIVFQDDHQVAVPYNSDLPIEIPEGWHV